MQQLQIYRKLSPFYCPVTGQQILFEEDYYSSPATQFIFNDFEGGKLMDTKPEISLLYNQALQELQEGKYDNYHFKYNATDTSKAFDVLIHEKLKSNSNIILFEINDAGSTCEPRSNTVFIGIDMSYSEVTDNSTIDPQSFAMYFSGFENYERVLFNATKQKPTLEGYALFMEDAMGCGGFYFINEEEEWTTLLPALVLLDYVNQEYSSIPVAVFDSLQKVYLDYFNAGIYDKLPKDFTPDLNAVLTDYKVVFFGKVIDLFEAKSDFSLELLEEFDGNPNDDITGFLAFLSTYSKY